MKKSDKIAYHQKNPPQLEKELEVVRKELVETRIKHSSGQLKDTSVLKKLKYKIALISTLLGQKPLKSSNSHQNTSHETTQK